MWNKGEKDRYVLINTSYYQNYFIFYCMFTEETSIFKKQKTNVYIFNTKNLTKTVKSQTISTVLQISKELFLYNNQNAISQEVIFSWNYISHFGVITQMKTMCPLMRDSFSAQSENQKLEVSFQNIKTSFSVVAGNRPETSVVTSIKKQDSPNNQLWSTRIRNEDFCLAVWSISTLSYSIRIPRTFLHQFIMSDQHP